jgi:hypothetical protein
MGEGVQTNIQCPGCGLNIRYERINIVRDDGAHDWRLDVWCPGCGGIRNGDILARVEFEHKKRAVAEIRAAQDECLDRQLGCGAHEYLKRLMYVCEAEKDAKR